MTTEKKEYIVTAKDEAAMAEIRDQLTSPTLPSETIPEREVEVAKERETNKQNTNYYLTEEEAEALKASADVIDVVDVSRLRIAKRAFQDTSFDKTTTSSGDKSNWGLLRHINTTNVFGTSTSDPGGTYDYVLDGTGVDVVIVDSGIQADHPEFEDADGTSRVQQIDWFAASGVSGTMPSGFYTDYDGHGTHVAGTVAGKTFGWAKNAHIYSIKLAGLEGTSDPNNGISASDMYDVILGWHNAKTNGRPTVVNHSWGYVIFWDASLGELSFGATGYPITGGSYRGATYSGSAKDTAKGHTGALVTGNTYIFGYPVVAEDVDIQQHIDAGIFVCIAAGNSNVKMDVSGGTDYDNYVTATSVGNFYYHRGQSPNVRGGNGFMVGSFGAAFNSSIEAKAQYSDAGAGVKIYAAGDRIVSAMSNTNVYSSDTSAYHLDGSYKQAVISGTSMASPQIAGIAALVYQAHPDWTTSQVYNWILSKSQDALYSTGLDDDYNSEQSLFGGSSSVAYFNMVGQKPYSMTASN